MIHATLNTLIAQLAAEFPAVRETRYYKGEFEPDVDWDPVFPCLLVNCPSVTPAASASQSRALVGLVTVSVYAGMRAEDSEQQGLLADILQYTNRLNDDETLAQLGNWKLTGVFLVGYFKGIEAYRIQLSLDSAML